MRASAPARLPLVLALAAACQRPVSTTEPPTEPPPPVPGKADPSAPTPAADPTHPLELVPARARAMAMVRSPQRLAQLWGRDAFASRFPGRYEALVRDMVRDLGRDLLDPSVLASMGIDPTAPLGVAMLSATPHEAFMVFGGCSNPKALVELAERIQGKPLPVEPVGQAQVVRLADGIALVVRHGLFALVGYDREGVDRALEVARIDPAQSLAHSTTMERAHAGLPQEADVHALLDVAGLVHDAIDAEQQRQSRRLGEANLRLTEARQRGASADELDAIQRSIASEQEHAERRRREGQMVQLLLSRTLGAIEGVGLAVTGDDRGLLGKIHVALGPDAIFRELLGPSERAPSVITALDDVPQLVLSARADVGVAIDLLAQVLLASGSSYARLDEELQRDLSLELDRAVRPLLDGRGTFVLTTTPRADPARTKGLDEVLGGLLAVGVVDEVEARAVLDQVVAKHPDAGFVAAPEIFGYTIARKDAPRELGLGIIDGQLVVGTDMALLRRVRDGKAGKAGTHFPDPEPWQRLSAVPGVGRFALHHRVVLASFMTLMGELDSFSFPHDPDHVLAEQFPDADVFSIPRSPKTQRLEKQRNAAFEAEAKLRTSQRERRRIEAWNEADALGMTLGVVHLVDTGLVIEGGHYVKGGLAGYATTLGTLAGLLEGETTDPALARAEERVQELESRLLDARRRDVEHELARRGR